MAGTPRRGYLAQNYRPGQGLFIALLRKLGMWHKIIDLVRVSYLQCCENGISSTSANCALRPQQKAPTTVHLQFDLDYHPHEDTCTSSWTFLMRSCQLMSRAHELIWAHKLSSRAHNRIAQNDLKIYQIDFKLVQNDFKLLRKSDIWHEIVDLAMVFESKCCKDRSNWMHE